MLSGGREVGKWAGSGEVEKVEAGVGRGVRIYSEEGEVGGRGG